MNPDIAHGARVDRDDAEVLTGAAGLITDAKDADENCCAGPTGR